jgi:hypothetical protein
MANAASASTHIQSALNASTTDRSRALVSRTGWNPSGPSASTPWPNAGSGERSTNWPAPLWPVCSPVVSVNIR